MRTFKIIAIVHLISVFPFSMFFSDFLKTEKKSWEKRSFEREVEEVEIEFTVFEFSFFFCVIVES